MLIQMKEIKTKTYPLDKGFFVDITTTCKTYQAWIYHREYGIKDLMFEIPKEHVTYEKILDIVELNANQDIEIYAASYMD